MLCLPVVQNVKLSFRGALQQDRMKRLKHSKTRSHATGDVRKSSNPESLPAWVVEPLIGPNRSEASRLCQPGGELGASRARQGRALSP